MTHRNRALSFVLSSLLLLPASAVFAGDLNTVINGKSFHIGSDADWNEKNLGLGVEYYFDGDSNWKRMVMANAFRDSYDEMSYMAGAGLHRTLLSSNRAGGAYVDVGLNMFLMSRQNINDGKPFPGALPSLAVGNRYYGVNLTYLPAAMIEAFTDDMDDDMEGVVFLQFKVNVTELLRND